MCYTTKELDKSANSPTQKPGEYVWEWISRVWDNDGRNIKLDQHEFIDAGLLSGDFRFNMETPTVKKVAEVCLNGWLKSLSKDGLLEWSWRCLISLA